MADPKLATARPPLKRALYKTLVLTAALRLLATSDDPEYRTPPPAARSFALLADDLEAIAALLEQAGAREA